MTREEHLAWCKKRAHEYLDRGDIQNAVASMISDLNKHEETRQPSTSPLNMLGLLAASSDDYDKARRYIDGFN